MDILDYLQADHDALRELIIDLKVAEPDTNEEAELVMALTALVRAQTEAQEGVLFPLAGANEALRQVIMEDLKRNVAAQRVLDMIQCCTNSVTWRSSVNIYCELLESGMRRRARELFSALFEELDPELREYMGETYKRLRGYGQNAYVAQPHRGVWSFIHEAV